MEKILFVSNIAKRVGTFSLASIEAAKKCGIQFHMAANWDKANVEQIRSDEEEYNVKIHNIPLSRNPYSLKNIKAYKQLVSIKERRHRLYSLQYACWWTFRKTSWQKMQCKKNNLSGAWVPLL